MSYIEFDKTQLINLEYSLNKELIRSNGAGSYASTTITGCNTRKYHGLLICPQEHLDGGNHMLLSSLDESVIQHGSIFNLAIHKYPGVYEPKGHKYIRDFQTEPIMAVTYRVGGVVLKKEILVISGKEQLLIRYTLLDAHSPTILRFKPFLGFRNVHALSKSNLDVNTTFNSVGNGIKTRMYNGYSYLYMQFSKKVEYVPVPHWHYNVEYIEEQRRGYDFQEDLYVPGYFELPIKKGESIVFSASLHEETTQSLNRQFEKEISSRLQASSFENCLIDAAHQFIVRSDKKTEIIAGFPWFGRWGRDTFISLPGLTLAIDDVKTCKAVIDTMSSELKGALFPNIGSGDRAALNSVDAPLWYFWALQQYCGYADCYKSVWTDYGKKMKKILKGYRKGTEFNIKMLDNGLIYAGESGKALTWMDAVVHGKPVTPRMGCPVEINALWYNAIKFSLESAEKTGDTKFISEWKDIPALIEKSFIENFWDPKKRYLADYIDGEYKDWSVRPNQVFVTSLPYSPVNDEVKKSVLDKIEKELLTPKGLRTLSPESPDYKGIYDGDQAARDEAYHQGTVWPWLLGHFAEGYLKIHGKGGIAFIERLYLGFEEDMLVHGIGSISEIYEGDPPHRPDGAISQAWSVAELLRIKKLIEKTKNNK